MVVSKIIFYLLQDGYTHRFQRGLKVGLMLQKYDLCINQNVFLISAMVRAPFEGGI